MTLSRISKTALGLTLLLWLSVQIAAACSLAAPSLIISCTPRDGSTMGDYVDGFGDSAESIHTALQSSCPNFDVANSDFEPIYAAWDAGVGAGFFNYTMLFVEPYSAERELEILKGTEFCYTNTVQRTGDWVFYYGELNPYCTVNPGDGASCPFVEVDQSALRSYCDSNEGADACSAIENPLTNPSILIGIVGVSSAVLVGTIIVRSIRKLGDD